MSETLFEVKFCECEALLHLRTDNVGNIHFFCKCGYNKQVYDRDGKSENNLEDGVTLDTIDKFITPSKFGQNDGYIIVSK